MFRYMNQVDDQGFFLLKDQFILEFTFLGIQINTLPMNYTSDVLMELNFENEGDLLKTVFESATDRDGFIVCCEMTVDGVHPFPGSGNAS